MAFRELTFSLLIISSVMYLAKLTSFSPVYFLQPLLSGLFLFKSRSGFSYKVNICSLVFFILFLYLLLLNFSYLSGNLSTFVNFFTGLLSFMVIISSYSIFSIESIRKILVTAVKVISIILLIDSLYRLLHPSMPSPEAMAAIADTSNAFYMFKFGTLMFADSNTVAIVCVSYLFLCFYCRDRFGFNFGLYPFLLFLIMISCLSRAAIVATLTSYFIFTNRFSVRAKLFFLSFGAVFAFSIFLNKYLVDDSFLSKFYILSLFYKYILSADVWDFIFGVGLDNSPTVLDGIYSHIHVITAMVEFGFLGLSLIIGFLFFCLVTSRFKAGYIILPNLILGLSYFFYLGSPFVFVPIALIIMLEKRSRIIGID